MNHTSHIEISKSALENNINFIQNLLGPEVKYSSIVKGNAYGHGIDKFCPLAHQFGIDHFSVFGAHEAQSILNCLGSSVNILIMGQIDNDQITWAIENDISFFVFEESRLNAAIKAAIQTKKKAKIHIEMETGMNRTGFSPKELPNIINKLRVNKEHIEIEGICTHLAGAESIANYKRIKTQQKRFSSISKKAKSYGLSSTQFHMACSAAAIRYPKTRLDMVRVGIIQYGFFPNNETLIHYLTKNKLDENPLERVLSWKSKVMDIKSVKAGEFVGYGTSFFTNHDSNIAIVPVGYAHGFSRSLSNQGKVIIQGKRLNVVGTINMNMLAVDVTQLENLEVGEEVILIGKQDSAEISVSSFSEYSDLVNYELLTRLPIDIPRIIK